MVSLRPVTVIGALCVTVAVVGAPAATVQAEEAGPRVVVTDLPVLSELPPLPSGDATDEVEDDAEREPFALSGVQTIALTLAVAALVVGGAGLALVTRRGRSTPADAQSEPTDPDA